MVKGPFTCSSPALKLSTDLNLHSSFQPAFQNFADWSFEGLGNILRKKDSRSHSHLKMCHIH